MPSGIYERNEEWKRRVYSKERNEKISIAQKGRPNPAAKGNHYGFKKGGVPWNKGKKFSKHVIEKISSSMNARSSEEISNWKKKISEANKGHTHSKEYKERLRQAMLGNKNPAKKPGIGKKISEAKMGHNVSEETRQKLRIAAKRRFIEKSLSSYFGAKGKNNFMYEIHENHPNWKGGLSFEPYSLDFNKQFKETIRERDNHCCIKCNKPQEELNYKLHIHHIDYDKKNSFPQNCASLCRNCHIETNFNREAWKAFFQSLLKKRYGYEYTINQNIILDFGGLQDGTKEMEK